MQLLHNFKRIPIAWLQVLHQPAKLCVALAGICFSNLLMFFQMGLMDSLYNSQCKSIELMDADLIMISSRHVSLSSLVSFPRRKLYQTMGIAGVKYVTPLRIGRAKWINPSDKKAYDIYIYGTNPAYPSLLIPELANANDKLKQLRMALFDRKSKSQYGDVINELARSGKVVTEIEGQKVDVIGSYSMGATFAADANLIVGDSTFLYLFRDQKPEQIQVGLIKLNADATPGKIQSEARSFLTDDVRILTKPQFISMELNYWKENSSVGYIFGLGVIVGFIVGAIIVYQILFSDVTNSLAQYATLKAMGYSDIFVISIVIQQSAILAFLGFIPGIGLSYLLYGALADATGLAVVMTVQNAVIVLLLTFLMCVGSGIIATKRLIKLDPADIF